MLRLRNVGVVSVTERGALSTELSLFIALEEEFLAEPVRPLGVLFPRLARV